MANEKQIVQAPETKVHVHRDVLRIVLRQRLSHGDVAILVETLQQYSRAKRWEDQETLKALTDFAGDVD